MNIEIVTQVNAAAKRQYPARRRFIWSTDIVSYGLKEQRNQRWSRPKRQWIINWRSLTHTERNSLLELFMRAAGQFRTFKIYDKDGDNDYGDYECGLTDWSHTASDGEATTQLQKTYYIGETEEWTENKKLIVPGTTFAPTIKIDAAEQTEGIDYTLSDTTGIITWASPLSAGEVVTANYRFYFACRFIDDTHEDIRRLQDRWQAEGIELLEVVT